MTDLLHSIASLFATTLVGGEGVPAPDRFSPTVDVRIEAPFTTVAHGAGDEWAPSWSPAGQLFTGNHDGGNFGGLPGNVIIFGRVEGDDPAHLRDTVIGLTIVAAMSLGAWKRVAKQVTMAAAGIGQSIGRALLACVDGEVECAHR